MIVPATAVYAIVFPSSAIVWCVTESGGVDADGLALAFGAGVDEGAVDALAAGVGVAGGSAENAGPAAATRHIKAALAMNDFMGIS